MGIADTSFPIWETGRTPKDQIESGLFFLIDKPLGWTSFDVVRKLRNLLTRAVRTKKLKVGHAGTLDPLATGLMIVCSGKATKSTERLMDMDKEYVATLEFGRTTPSFDMETSTDQTYPYQHITLEALEAALQSFIGTTLQTPPLFSAKNIGGIRAYEFARQGSQITLEARPVTITQLDILSFALPTVVISIRCSKGTYIRALVRDIGLALQSGACMTALRRTAIGDLTVDRAYDMVELDHDLRNMN